MTVVTRFAPSPTGTLHIGNARTALFNWLLARHNHGKLVLRIEDTDKERSTPENVQVILDGMAYLGIDFDEGPFYQSERTEKYMSTIHKLIDDGKAYRCRCSAEELQAKREQAQAEKRTYLYDRCCRDKNYGPEEPHVVRLKMPTDGATVVDDKIMGRVEVKNGELDDWIILRTDGSPVYNFCVVVDDSDMGVTLVVRGADHLINTHKQLGLYAALGLQPPEFGHMPLTLGQDRSKLSKRHGATSLLQYKEMGYLPQAMRNFLVRLGWSHGDQELFTDEELIQLFDLKGVNSSNAVFDMDKLNWINAQKIKQATAQELIEPLMPFLLARGYAAQNDPRLPEIVTQLQERSTTLADMADQARIFYLAPTEYDEKSVKKWWKEQAKGALERFLAWVKQNETFEKETIMPFLDSLAQEMGVGLGKVAQPVRIAATGSSASPGLDITLVLIGRDEVIARVEKALATLG